MLPLLGAITPIIQKLLNFIPDPNQRAQLAAESQKEIMEALQASDAAQAQINNTEASSGKLMDQWRDGAGWVCVMALFYQYLLVPIGMWAAYFLGHPIPKPPTLDNNLWELMTGLLGLGGLHMYQKVMK